MMDVLVFILLLWGGFRGFRRGIIAELFSALAVATASLGSFTLFKQVMHRYVAWSSTQVGGLGHCILFASVFAVIFLVVRSVGTRLADLVHVSRIGHILDGLLGGILGASKWVLGISTVLWASRLLHLPQQHIASSVLLSWIQSVAPTLAAWW